MRRTHTDTSKGGKMKFINRETEFPGKVRLIRIDSNGNTIDDEEIFAYIIKEENPVYVEGTPITAENLNKGNWRDDDCLSFKQRTTNASIPPKAGETQIVTDAEGETWIIPPALSNGQSQAIRISNTTGTSVKVGGNLQTEINFASDPQTQIDSAWNVANTANGAAVTALGAVNDKSRVTINNIKSDLNFSSSPQVQIDNLNSLLVSAKEQSVKKYQGTENAGKSVVVGPDGNIDLLSETGALNTGRFVQRVQGSVNANSMLVTDNYGNVEANGKLWRTVFSTSVSAGNSIDFNFTPGLYRLTYNTDMGRIVFLWESTANSGIDHSPWHTVRRMSAHQQSWLWINVGLERDNAASNNYTVRACQQDKADAAYAENSTMSLNKIERWGTGSIQNVHYVTVETAANTSATVGETTVAENQNVVIQVPHGVSVPITWKGISDRGQDGVRLYLNGSVVGTTASATGTKTISKVFTANVLIATGMFYDQGGVYK